MAAYTCPKCDTSFSVPDWLDSEVRCPTCGAKAQKAALTSTAIERSSRSRSATGANSATSATVTGSTAAAPATPRAASAGIPAAVGKWIKGQNKFLLFGGIGAIGCFLGAALGEALLALTYVAPPEPQPSQPNAVCLLIDCSGSMTPFFSWSSKLAEVKEAAKKFAAAQDLSTNTIAVIGFGSSVHLGTGPTENHRTISTAIDRLEDGGGTNMAAGLNAASEQLQTTTLPRTILLFTDGMPGSQADTLAAAQACRANDIRIIAIATEDADIGYLSQVTGDSSLVIPTTAGSFGQGFSAASQKIYGRSLVESGSTASGFGHKLLRVGAWTSLLALGLSMALIAGQNLYLGRRFLNLSQGISGTLGSLVAGFVAGTVGQILFAPFAWISILQSAGTIIGWSVLGALVGRGMSFFVPNLAPRRAFIGGGIGGAIGAVAFLVASGTLSDVFGRLLGAAILGLVIGLLIAFIEAAFRKVWLEVSYGPKEVVTVNLGEKPVIIGSDSNACTVFAFGAPSIALRYRLVGDEIQCEEVVAEKTEPVKPGDSRTVGNVTVIVRGA